MLGIGPSNGTIGAWGTADDEAVARPGRLVGMPCIIAALPVGKGIEEIADGKPPGAVIKPCGEGIPGLPPGGPKGTIVPGGPDPMGPKFIIGLGPAPCGTLALSGGELGAS